MINLYRQKPHIKVTSGDLAARHLGHMLVNTKLKIALCPIEKIASSQFRQVSTYYKSGFDFFACSLSLYDVILINHSHTQLRIIVFAVLFILFLRCGSYFTAWKATKTGLNPLITVSVVFYLLQYCFVFSFCML